MAQIIVFFLLMDFTFASLSFQTVKKLCPNAFQSVLWNAETDTDLQLWNSHLQHGTILGEKLQLIQYQSLSGACNQDAKSLVLDLAAKPESKEYSQAIYDHECCMFFKDSEANRESLKALKPSYNSNVFLYNEDLDQYTEVYTISGANRKN